MLRREIRKRKEYLYFKNKEALEKSTKERKKQLLNSLQNATPIPTELHDEEAYLRTSMQYDDSRWEKKNEMDNEYRFAGVKDPKVIVTTSRHPSSRLKMFAKEIRLIFPNCQRINRGESMLPELLRTCSSNDITDIVLLHETRGRPDTLIISHLPFGPTAYFTLYNVVMRHDVPDVGTMSEAFPHLIFHNFTKSLGSRAMDILKHLFPVPKEESKHHIYENIKSKENVAIKEVGPRFEMRLFRISLGTLIQPEAEIEWQLRPFMNTARKRLFIGEVDESMDEQHSVNTTNRDI